MLKLLCAASIVVDFAGFQSLIALGAPWIHRVLSMLSLLTTSQLSHSPTLNYCPTRSAGGPNMDKRMNLRFWGTRVGGCSGAYQPFHEHFTWAFLTNGLWEVSGVREMHNLLVFFLHHDTVAEMQPWDPRAQLAKSLSEGKLAWRVSGTLHG